MKAAVNLSEKKLFAVYLGGRAARCNTELHDVVFVVGGAIEECYEQLMAKWFGDPAQLHLDCWMELRQVDGYRVSLGARPAAGDKKLFFINLGAYLPGQFTEVHANAFVVAGSAAEVKKRAKGELLRGALSVHTDDLYEIDDCLEISEVDGLTVYLEPGADGTENPLVTAYQVIPRAVVEAYLESVRSRTVTGK